MDSVEDQFINIRTEWNVLKEKWFSGETMDPVFEGMIKDFCVFDVTMQDMYKKVETFMNSVDTLSKGLQQVSESAIDGLAQVDDALIRSDSCKMREATNQITRSDAPHSCISKLRRDMDFNIMNPIKCHLVNNRNLKHLLEKRRRRLLEFNATKRAHDDCVKRGLRGTDRRMLSAQSALESAKIAFHEVDKHIFEWLYILEEYKGDILDSTLQTLKYLQYEFFSSAAHAISGALPARMEFRPMVEMTPEHLQVQVDLELEEASEDEEEVVTDFSVRLIEKLAKDNKTKPGEGLDSAANDGPPIPVDPLSLASLLGQGFEEGPARQALRKFKNDTQAALDFLVSGDCGGGAAEEAAEDSVRMPTTVKRVQKLKAKRRAMQEKAMKEKQDKQAQEKASKDSGEEEDQNQKADASKKQGEAVAAPAAPAPAADLLDLDMQAPVEKPRQPSNDLLSMMEEEPPPPTDFSKEIVTAPLPPPMSFDLSRCEKPPLPGSVAAGTHVPRVGDAASSQGLDSLASLYEASAQPAVPMPGVGSAAAGAGYPAAAPSPDAAALAAQLQANGGAPGAAAGTRRDSGFAALDPLAMTR